MRFFLFALSPITEYPVDAVDVGLPPREHSNQHIFFDEFDSRQPDHHVEEPRKDPEEEHRSQEDNLHYGGSAGRDRVKNY